jgi:hypothetical protein
MNRTMLVCPLALCAILVSACGKGSDSAKEPGAAADTARDACTLLTPQDVETTYGSPVSITRESEGAVWSACNFLDPAKQNMFVMGIEVYWSGGKQQWRINNLAVAGGERMLEHAEQGADVKSIIANAPLTGLGDQAVFSGLMGGHVLKADTMIDFKFGLLEHPDTHFRPLAEKALSRL